MKNISSQKERIIQFIEYKGINNSEFYRKTGISNGVLSKKSGLSMDTVEKFYSNFPEINPEWLLTGKGEMLKQDVGLSVASEPEATPNEVAMVKDEMIAILKKDVEELRNDKQLLQDLVKAKYLGE